MAEGKRDFAGGRGGIAVKRGPLCHSRNQILDGLKRTDFMIGQHDGYEARVGTDEIFLNAHDSGAAYRQLGMDKTLADELLERSRRRRGVPGGC